MSKWSILLLVGVLMISAGQGYVAYWNIKDSHATYLISKDPEPFDLAKMNNRCKSSGGYLVEIDSKVEQGNLKSMLSANGLENAIVFTGITDFDIEGLFYHYNSHKPVTGWQVIWKASQPDNWRGKEHCVNLTPAGINDIECGTTGRYMCEIPR